MPVCITGMHRAGTSMVARLLNLCGLYLGRDEDLLEPMPDNPEGYWENAKFLKINQEVLTRLNGEWDLPPLVKDKWELKEEFAPLRALGEKLAEEFTGHGPWGWKDPRSSLTLPFWESVFPEVKVVVCIRSPLDVARSLQKRGYSSIAFSFNLWLTYYERLLAYTRPEGRIITHYDTFFSNPHEELKRLVDFLGLPAKDEVIKKASEVVSFSLHHHRSVKKDLLEYSEREPRLVNVYMKLCDDAGPVYQREVCDAPVAESAQPEHEGIQEMLGVSRAILRGLDDEDILNALDEDVPQDKLKQLYRELKSITDSHISKIEQRLNKKDIHIKNIEEMVKEKDGDMSILKKMIEDKDNHMKNLESLVKDKDNHIDNIERMGKDKDNHIKNLERMLGTDKDSVKGMMDMVQKVKGAMPSLEKLFMILKENTVSPELSVYAGEICFNLGLTGISKHFFEQVLSMDSKNTDALNNLGVIHTHARDFGAARKLFNEVLDLDPENEEAETNLAMVENMEAGSGEVDAYYQWIMKNEPNRKGLKKQRKAKFRHEPRISIIVPVYNTPEHMLKEMLESVLSQTYQKWELCIADGNSTEPHVRDVLGQYEKKDKRIKVKHLTENLGISGHSNAALSIATGDFVTFLDSDDTLTPFALYEVVKAINDEPDAEFIYSDEDKINEDGSKRYGAFFKPDWSPDTLLSYNYICHLMVIKKALVDRLGGFRAEYDGSQDYDLALRATGLAKKIIHIPRVLYHWRHHESSYSLSGDTKPKAVEAAKGAIADYLNKNDNGYRATVTDGLIYGTYRVRREIKDTPKVSIVMLTILKDREMVKTCLSSIAEKTTYSNYELLIVDRTSGRLKESEIIEWMGPDTNWKRIFDDSEYNWPKINNMAVQHTDGEYIILMNDDMEVLSPDWIESMLEHAQMKEVGAVGVKLYYPNDTVQHAGVIVGIGGVAGHCHKHFPRDATGYFSRLKVIQNLSAVTGACMMVRRDVYEEVGRIEEVGLPIAFNDIDFCLKILEAGYRVIWTPFAELYHFESITRGFEDTPEKQVRFKREVDFFIDKWKDFLDRGDPYYNPNLTLKREDYSLRI